MKARLRSHISIERVVVLATPIFAAASAWLTGLVANQFPGLPSVNPGDVTALEIAGATAATAAALKWLHGQATFRRDAAAAELELEFARKRVEEIVAANPAAGAALADIEALLKLHESDLETSIEAHLPKAVAASLAAMFGQLQAPVPAAVPFTETRIIPPDPTPAVSTTP